MDRLRNSLVGDVLSTERGGDQISQLKETYERFRPLIVWLGLAELAWIAYWLLGGDDTAHGYLATVIIWILAMLAWMVLVIFAGARGLFLQYTRWLSNLVGVVLVVAFAIVLFGSNGVAREGLLIAASGASDLQLALIHVLRLLAIGTVFKYIQGELPLHFVLLGSLPDFAFAISAVVVSILAVDGTLGREFYLVWHSVGFLTFLGAGISMFFSVPSPLRIYDDEPDTSIVFQFPMVLAPNFTVPLFMLAHVFALVKFVVS